MRMAIWHAGNTMSNILSGFLAAGILTNMDDVLGLHAWQWFFIIEGAASILVAAVAYILLPSWPHNTRWLTPEESEMAQYRVQVSNGGVDEVLGGTWDGVKDAARYATFTIILNSASYTNSLFLHLSAGVRRFWVVVVCRITCLEYLRRMVVSHINPHTTTKSSSLPHLTCSLETPSRGSSA
jgi:MFS family permease